MRERDTNVTVMQHGSKIWEHGCATKLCGHKGEILPRGAEVKARLWKEGKSKLTRKRCGPNEGAGVKKGHSSRRARPGAVCTPGTAAWQPTAQPAGPAGSGGHRSPHHCGLLAGHSDPLGRVGPSFHQESTREKTKQR